MINTDKEIELKPITVQDSDDKSALIDISQQATCREVCARPTFHKIIAVIAFYIITSITMIMVNKTVLNQAGLPMTFLWGQLVTAVILLQVAQQFRLLTLPPVNWEAAKQLRYLISLNVVGLALNTLCLQHIDAALYQVARSLILPITALISAKLSGNIVSRRVAIACTIITIGFLIGVGGEHKVQVSTIGVVFGVLSSAATAVHSFAIKHSFTQVSHNGAFDMVYYNNLFSSVLLLPMVLLEYPLLHSFVVNRSTGDSISFLIGTLIAGASGVLINLAGFLQIKVTSPLTHTVSSAARGVLQTIACRIFLHELVTGVRCVGIGVTLIGSALYSWFKSREL